MSTRRWLALGAGVAFLSLLAVFVLEPLTTVRTRLLRLTGLTTAYLQFESLRAMWSRESYDCGVAAAPAAPNVVLIAVDTLRADHLGHLGYSRPVSPHLDALAQDSLVFTNAIAPAPWTLASLAAVFTGVHPGALGIERDYVSIPEDAPTLGERFCEAGFRTAGVVSHSFTGARYGFDRGFERWDESLARGHEFVSSMRVTDRAIGFLEELREARRPFLLYVHYFDPHYDYLQHDGHEFGSAYGGPIRSAGNNIRTLRDRLATGEMDDDDLRFLVDSYDSEIAFTDRHIGRLLATLERMQLYDDALIVFLADHGEMFAEREDRWLGHGRYLWNEALHVPLLLKLPASGRTGRVERTVSTVEVFSVVLQLARISPPSPEPSLLDFAPSAASPVFAQTRRIDAGRDAIFERPWKLVRDLGDGSVYLFDLDSDPGEVQDLAAARPEIRARLETQLDDWLSELAALRSTFDTGRPLDLSEEELERLRSLGYVD